MRLTTSICGALLALGVFAAANAEGAAPAAGKYERVVVPGKSLAGNLSGDPSEREVLVYTPPGYAADTKKRYPVIYFLHGYGVTAQFYANQLDWPASINRALSSGNLKEMIVVMPDAFTPLGGSMYSRSVTTGDWEAFVARDLVRYIDGHYRTIPRRESRGLSGHSMGGYGTLRIGMKYPDVFVALYSMSGCCLDPRTVTPSDAPLEKLATLEDVEKIQVLGRTTLAASAAWTPNAKRPPFFFDLPTTNGETRKDIVAKYATNAPTVMVPQYARQLKRYKAIALDVGLKDPLLPGNVEIDQVLTKNGVNHTYETYDGDHVNRVPQRFEAQVLPFFSKQLAGQ